MVCPQCQSREISHSPNPWLHMARTWMRSPKYYCHSCQAKWKAFPRGRSRVGYFFPLAILLSFSVFLISERLAWNWSLGSKGSSSGMMELIKDPVLAGKLMRAQTDPSSLKNLTSSERSKLSSMKKALMNSGDAGAMGMLTQVIGDSSLAERVMRAKGNPASLKNLSAGDKKKLKEIKDRMSPSQIQKLKAEYAPK